MNKRAILFIDTSSNTEVTVSLELNGEKQTDTKTLDRRRAQVVLPLVEELLARNKLQPEDITNVEVVTGPGSFTGLRVGVSIANMISEYLKIPINDKPNGTIVTPHYS